MDNKTHQAAQPKLVISRA